MRDPAYYNENDKFVAQWLRNLIARNLIAPGEVDERSIVDVRPGDLAGFVQCHFFAGIGGWSLALRIAGWPDDRPVWTGSCPCQPFSAAGAQRGSDDDRHLWPAFFGLIRERRPATIFGEQVAGAAGLAWLDHVCADLELEGYAAAAADLPAACVGAPHIRQRLWWVANAGRERGEPDGFELAGAARGRPGEARQQRVRDDGRAGGIAGRLADDDDARRSIGSETLDDDRRYAHRHDADGRGAHGGMADDAEQGRGEEPERDAGTHGRPAQEPRRLRDAGGERMGDAERARLQGRIEADVSGARGSTVGLFSEQPGGREPWRDLEWLACRDGKYRPTQPGLFPLANGVPGRVGRLRAYGNAIVPEVGAEFVRAVMDCMP